MGFISRYMIKYSIFNTGDVVIPQRIRSQPLKIVQRFHFSSALKRMTVIASMQEHSSPECTFLATVKGAPETLRPMVRYYQKI